MRSDDLTRQGEHVMTICNACRYCEGYCPVFPAMENRLIFAKGDLAYLANLCHNCGECLYACQYAPPHEFAINVPNTLARIRLRSYEAYCWPRPLAAAYKSHVLFTALVLPAGFIALMFALQRALRAGPVLSGGTNFYRVVPHRVMVGSFGGVALLVMAALVVGVVRFWRDMGDRPLDLAQPSGWVHAVGDALTLKHLHGSGVDCTHAEEGRSRWRRWFHHFTVYGFMLCFASTSVAAVYHQGFGWVAPYAYASAPVILGTAGGIGLIVGPAGLFYLRRTRDQALTDPEQRGLDESFIVLLFMTSLTGLLLLVTRNSAAMGIMLLVHLGFVLTLFLTLPYGKFVHGLYRTAALIRYALENPRTEPEVEAAVPTPSISPYDRGPAPVASTLPRRSGAPSV
jgi:citrate/tricarballylate utilization protein